MSKIKQVIRLHKDGKANRAIGRELGLYKGTVNKYVKLAEDDPLSLDELLALEDPVLEKRFCGGNPAYSDKRFDELQERLPYIAEELSNKSKTMWHSICYGRSTREITRTDMSTPSSVSTVTSTRMHRSLPSS